MAAVLLSQLAILATAQQDAAQAASPPEGLQVLKCVVTGALPSPPAEAQDGGFHFQFESLGGTAVDGRACTVYRLRNVPGSPPTPVRWTAGSDVLVEAAGLRRCGDEASCVWLEVARYFDGDFVRGETTVSYGLNADSFHVPSPGFVAFASPDMQGLTASVGTEVVGTVVTADGLAIELDLVVKSRFERDEAGVRLFYEATADDPAQLDGSRFLLVWEALDGLGPASFAPGDAKGPFLLDGQVAPQGHTSGVDGTVSLQARTQDVGYEDRLVLSIVVPGTGEVMLRVPLPAFVPAGR